MTPGGLHLTTQVGRAEAKKDDTLSSREWALIGGVSAAGLVLLVLLIIILCVVCRRHRQKHSGSFGEILIR